MRAASSRSGFLSRQLLLAGFVLSLSGCLVSSNTEERKTGTNVSPDVFAQIEPGKTTIEWVQATLGDPTTKSLADKDLVWTYTYVERKDSTGAVFLIFGGHSSSETTHNVSIQFKDGIVIKKWQG